MSPVFHKRLARQVELHLHSEVEGVESPFDACSLLEQVRATMKSKRSLAPARKRKAARLRSKKSETRDIRAAVARRASGACECGCRAEFTQLNPGELDHFFGRVLVPQSVETTWMLTRACHREKTRGFPSAGDWARRFVAHCETWADFGRQHCPGTEEAQDRFTRAACMAEALAEKHRVKAELRGRA